MINELVVLADELDKLGEREAADIIDKLVKTAIEPEEALKPLEPEDDWVDEPTKTDLEPMPMQGFKVKRFELEDADELIRFIDSLNPKDYAPEDAKKIARTLEIAASLFRGGGQFGG